MLPRSTILLLFPSVFSLGISAQSCIPEPQITAAPSSTQPTPSQEIPTILTTPTPFSSPTSSPGAWGGLLSSAEYLLDELNEHLHVDLRKRQGGIAATNAPQATTVATQMSPITTYGADRGWPVKVYTQVFAAVPDPWPSPEAGTIGLGTIQGQVGVIKTNSKRMAQPEPTGQVFRIKGREVVAPTGRPGFSG